MSAPLGRPLPGSALGYVFAFRWSGEEYGLAVAEVVLDALRCVRFSGRCEYYAIDRPTRRLYLVGLGLGSWGESDGPEVEANWAALTDAVAAGCLGSGELALSRLWSRCARLRSIRRTLMDRGAAAFDRGRPIRVLGRAVPQAGDADLAPELPPDLDSWWLGAVDERCDEGSED